MHAYFNEKKNTNKQKAVITILLKKKHTIIYV